LVGGGTPAHPEGTITQEIAMQASHVSVVGALVLVLGQNPSPPPLQHPHEAGRPPEQLGTVAFETSCEPGLQPQMNRAIALLHSFWFGAAADAFTAIGEKDPSCGIAWWGVAMSRWGNPFAPSRPVAALQQGREAIAKARAAGAKTDREREYIEAAAALFTEFEKIDHRTRIVNYERAMERVYKKHPADREAAAFYALAANQTALPTDKSYTQQLKAAAILEELFKSMPDHPGVAHYLIHAYDHPPLAERALPAARRYAKIAPDAPHALHMPSHTFTRVGHWEDSIATNLASAEAARKANSAAEVLHALDYQVYAYLQTAQDAQAQRVIRELEAILADVNTKEQYGQVGFYAAAAIPARYALERGDWQRAATLATRQTPFPFIDAITHFARAIGAARTGNAAAAKGDAQKLVELRELLLKDRNEYWAQQVEIQHTAALGWIALAEKRNDEALGLLRAAAKIEDSTDKSAISPGPLAPAREMLGEMLIELDRPAEALAELEAVMKKEPNRFRALYHGAKAASLSRNEAKAAQYFAELVKMCPKADANGRSELSEARKRTM
jgi:tetratricopeptide (TPR) repeat protein